MIYNYKTICGHYNLVGQNFIHKKSTTKLLVSKLKNSYASAFLFDVTDEVNSRYISSFYELYADESIKVYNFTYSGLEYVFTDFSDTAVISLKTASI